MKLSIILPSYNAEKYLHQAIDSILTQTFTEFELIIIDDGSTDNSFQIIQSFNDDRIKVIKNKKNEGIVRSLNKGIEVAKGKYIARMDADDIAMPERLKVQIAYLERYLAVDLVASSVEIIDDCGNTKSRDIRTYTSEMIECLLIFTCPIYHPTIMCRGSVLRQFKYDECYKGVEDWELWTRMIETKNIVNIPDVLLKYRLHNQNVSQQKSLIIEQRLTKILSKQLEKYFNIETKTLINTHLQTCANIQLSKPIRLSIINENEKWLRQLQNLNTKKQLFNVNIFNFALNLTWYNYLSRHIHNGKWYFIKFVFIQSFSLSIKQRMIILAKIINTSKFKFLFSPFVQVYHFLKN